MATTAAHVPTMGAVNRPLVTGSIMLATLIQVLDGTVANVALPDMRASLGAGPDTITWVLTSYIVASVIATPITGWLADRVGLKRLFLIAVAGFTAFSMLCGIAVNLPEMVAFRIGQGVFGAFLIPLGQTVLLDIYPKEKHGVAMSWWGMSIMVGPVLGPVVGGWLTESFDWRWVFYVNLPLGVIAFVGLLVSLPERATTRRRFDLLGFTLFAVAVGAFQMMLDRGEQVDWFAAWEVLIYAGLAVGGIWMFVVHTATAPAPIFSRAIFADRNLVTALAFIFVVGILLLAGMALMPPMLQQLFGYPVLTTGLVLAPRGVGTIVTMFIAGRLVTRMDPRILVFTGLTLVAISLWQMTQFAPGMDMRPVIVSGVVQGLGLGLIFTPLSTIAFATLSPHLRTDASSLFALLRNLGSSVGISLVTTLTARNLQTSHADLASRVTPVDVPLVDPGVAEAAAGFGDAALAALDLEVNRQALMIAYIDDFQFLLWTTIAVMPLVLLLRRPPPISATVPVAMD